MQASIVMDHLDMLIYLDVRRETEIITAEQEAEDDLLLPALLQDVWAAAYLPEPELVSDVPPYLAVEKRLVERLLANPAWAEVRAETVLDEWLSAALTVSTAKKLLALLPEEARALEREASIQEQRAQDLEEKARELEKQGLTEQARAAEEVARQAAEQAWAAAQAALEKIDQAGTEIERRLTRAALETVDTVQSLKETLNTCRAWGTEPGRPHAGVPGKDVLTVARELSKSPRLREIVKLAGRFTRIAFQKRRSKVKREPAEITSIEIGNDLSRILPSELSALADPARKMDFYQRFLERKLLQYRLDARVPQGKGPLVVCVDESGSMSGKREIWAKAVALACFNLAAKEGRAYALIHFGSACEIRVDRFPKPRRAGLGEVLSAVEHFFGGGTDFETPLARALEVMEESPFRRGDVVFITDGECCVSSGFLERFNRTKQAKEFSVFAVLVEQGTERAVQPFADRIVRAAPGRNDIEILEKIAAPA